MKILPINKQTNQNLSFRLKLDIQFDKQVKIAMPYLKDFFQSTNGIRYEDSISNPEDGIDIDFEIERTDGSEPSIATLVLWNITNDIFNQIANSANAFELYAAKGTDDWGLIFRGYPYFSTQENAEGGNNKSRGFLKRDEAKGGENDIATKITLIDSLHAFDTAVISKSYQGKFSSKEILKDCATAMGVFIGDGVDNYPMMNNYVARGKVRTVLREICGKIGCKYVIDNGVLHLFDGKKRETYGFSFDASNSSRPELEQKKDSSGYHFVTQLLPSIRAGQFCQCNFDTLSGTREIYKAAIRGNNYGTAGETEIWVK